VRPRSVGTHGGYTNFIRYSILWVNLNLSREPAGTLRGKNKKRKLPGFSYTALLNQYSAHKPVPGKPNINQYLKK